MTIKANTPQDEIEHRELLELAHKNGGVLLIPVDGDKIRAIIAIDNKHPEKVFDRLNEIEVELVKSAYHNIEKVKKLIDWFDDIRLKAREDCAKLGFNITL